MVTRCECVPQIMPAKVTNICPFQCRGENPIEREAGGEDSK
jgi:hypothetical protein